MKRFLGICSLLVAFGMVLMLFMENLFVEVSVIVILLVLGFALFR